MKKFLFLTSLLISIVSYAQDPFKGKWEARCVYEQVDPGNLRSCDLCPNRMMGDKMDIVPITIEWKDNLMKLSIGKDEFSTPFEWNEELKTIRFDLRGVPYIFRMIYGLEKDMMLWKNDLGMMVFLSEAKTSAPKGGAKK